MCKKNDQKGFSYLEIICAILIMTIGIIAALSAISLAMMNATGAETKNSARQISTAALESIFAVRDMRSGTSFSNVGNPLNNWAALNNNTITGGIFASGWKPVREHPGADGISGTADDTCAANVNCPGNNSKVIPGFERSIIITDINEEGIPVIRKKKIEISVRYFVGQQQRTETIRTIITDLPFNQ